MTNTIELREIASNLFDGGWRSTDKDEIQSEYDFNDSEIEVVIEALLDYENGND